MATTIGLGLLTLTLGDSAASSTSSGSSSESTSTKSAKTSKSPPSQPTPPSAPSSTSPSSSTSTSVSTTPSTTTVSSTSSSLLPTITQTAVSTSSPSSTQTPTQSAPSSHTSAAVIAIVVVGGLIVLAVAIYLMVIRRQLKQREWTFQEHQRIFEQSGKFGAKGDPANDDNHVKRKSRLSQWFHPTQTPPPGYYGNFGGGGPPATPLPSSSPGEDNVWGAGTGGAIISNYEKPAVTRKPLPLPKTYPQTQRKPDDSYRVLNPAQAMHLESYELGRRG